MSKDNDTDEQQASPEQTVSIEVAFQREGSVISRVFGLLRDKQWHCRTHEGSQIASGQYAGGGGIQGLQRGNNSRPGLVIESKNDYCEQCRKPTRWDRWTGEVREANAAANIPPALVRRVLALYNRTDAIEERERAVHELVIDHRFPMQRWGGSEPRNRADMSETDIRAKFQLLKKDGSGNHNLLKSRACEHCLATRERGKPFGIPFWYEGSTLWPGNVPEVGPDAERGCHGCGWYNFDAWRQALRDTLNQLAAEMDRQTM